MTKAELVDEVARNSDLNKKDAEVIVQTVLDSIVDSLKAGENIVAVHCHNQKNSPGFIDFGIAELIEKDEK